MATVDYRQDLDIRKMVFNRLPFLADNPNNIARLGETVLEVMSELELCFLINSKRPEGTTDTWVGWEEKYSIDQRSIIADVVTVYLLMHKALAETGGTASGASDGTTEGKFLKKTKAGSVEVEWDQVDSKKGGMMSSSEDLITMYKESARRKAAKLGCTITWDNDDLIIDRESDMHYPMLVVSSKCGCDDDNNKTKTYNSNDLI